MVLTGLWGVFEEVSTAAEAPLIGDCMTRLVSREHATSAVAPASTFLDLSSNGRSLRLIFKLIAIGGVTAAAFSIARASLLEIYVR